MPIIHGGLAAGYWVTDFLALSGGVVLRNQPELKFRGDFGVIEEATAALAFGSLAGIPWIAAEVEIDHTVGIVGQIELPILGDVLFGPTLSIGIRGVIGHGPTMTRRPKPVRELGSPGRRMVSRGEGARSGA
jgi:hypothetical protein